MLSCTLLCPLSMVLLIEALFYNRLLLVVVESLKQLRRVLDGEQHLSPVTQCFARALLQNQVTNRPSVCWDIPLTCASVHIRDAFADDCDHVGYRFRHCGLGHIVGYRAGFAICARLWRSSATGSIWTRLVAPLRPCTCRPSAARTESLQQWSKRTPEGRARHWTWLRCTPPRIAMASTWLP